MSPHVFVVGRFFVEKIRILPKFVDFFFFFFACQNVGVPLICRLKIVNVDGAAEKSVGGPPPPPPAHELIWELCDYGLVAVRKKHYVPPIITFGFPPMPPLETQ